MQAVVQPSGSPKGQQPLLNFDVLFTVMSFSDRHSLARLMCTCSTLRRQGARLLLDGQVPIRHQTALVSFMAFIRSHPQTALSHLRSLHLSLGTTHSALAFYFAKFLACMPNLHTLCLSNAKQFLASHPILLAALWHMSSLRHLTILNAGPLSFRGMKAPLAEPEAFFDALDDRSGPAYHPTMLCSPLANTLQELRIQYSRRYGAVVLSAPHVYPNMRKLTLEDNWPFVLPYITSFPNLTHLMLNTTYASRPPSVSDVERLEDQRELNYHTQTLHAQWPHLEYAAGDVFGLYALGLACHVCHMRVAMMGEPVGLEYLFPVLEHAEPKRVELELTTNLLAELPEYFADYASDLAASLSALKLTCIGVISPANALGHDVDVAALLDALIDALKPYRTLTTFELVLASLFPEVPVPVVLAAHAQPAAPREAPSAGAPAANVDESLAAFDPRAFAEKLARAVPSLRAVKAHVSRQSMRIPVRGAQLYRLVQEDADDVFVVLGDE